MNVERPCRSDMSRCAFSHRDWLYLVTRLTDLSGGWPSDPCEAIRSAGFFPFNAFMQNRSTSSTNLEIATVVTASSSSNA